MKEGVYYGESSELTPNELNYCVRQISRCQRKREYGLCPLENYNPFQCEGCECEVAHRIVKNLDELTKARVFDKAERITRYENAYADKKARNKRRDRIFGIIAVLYIAGVIIAYNILF